MRTMERNALLRAVARVAYLFGRNPKAEDELLLAAVKSNIGPEPPTYAFELDTHEFADIGEVVHLVALGERGDSQEDARIMIDTSRPECAPRRPHGSGCANEPQQWLNETTPRRMLGSGRT